MGLPHDQLEQIQHAMRGICPFSTASNLAVVLTVLLNKSKQSHLGCLQAILAVVEVWLSICWMVGNSIATNINLCSVFGTLHQYSIIASSCWSFMIALYCYLIVIYSPNLANSLWRYYLMYGFGTPVLFTIAMYVSQAVLNRGIVTGDADYQCWIAAQYPELRVLLDFPLLWFQILAILFFYIRILVVIRSRTRDLISSQNRTKTEEASIAVKSEVNDMSRSSVPGSQSFSGPAANNISAHARNGSATYQPNSGDCGPEVMATQQLPRFSSPTAVPFRVTVTNSAPAAKMTKSRNKLIAKTFVVSVGCFISWLPPTVVRILLLIPGTQVPFWLSYLTGVGFAMSGLFNSAGFLVGILWDHFLKSKSGHKVNGGVDSIS
ncbi:hypothetical protein BCR33DRAFT_717526 [Rhizoclosmatium globosum]|uniref:G-protein coupled receptors family 2 profile 2 domain-containing protein n=1 Tax=Rhizoclosmatium globosum TaxID=329046 RepID=A0A1Y2C8B8_9FUNG|nr:hypothetical protein BCR33DRAFT_717526 [Rhizoclosmatium globosum]|eukprot:ORY43282.1 hypothetical protein BCR33DRAFT_717526 [Rhizoclosmatium globosum]